MDRVKKIVFIIPVLFIFSCAEEESSESSTESEVSEGFDTVETSEVIDEEDEYLTLMEVPPASFDDPCFPYPDEKYVNYLKDSSYELDFEGTGDPLYDYLIYHFDSLEEKQHVELEDEWDLGVYEWSQKFSNDFTYSTVFHGEGGATSTIYTPCTNLDGVYSTINALVNQKYTTGDTDGSWNDERNEYAPLEGIGCWYNIILDDSTDTYKVENYCGC